MKLRRAHLLLALLAAPLPALGCGARSGEAALASVDVRGDLALSDGRRARLGGVQLAPEAAAAMEAWRGRRVGVALLAPAPDRWGRWVVDLVDGERGSLALDLLTRGLARVRPEAESRACEGERLDAEAGARAAEEGVWGRAEVYPAADTGRLAAMGGKFVVVTGVVRRVGEGRASVYLDFAGHDGFSVTVARKVEPQFRRAGVRLEALAGARVLVRGVLDDRFGPRMEIADPAMIEVLATGKGE